MNDNAELSVKDVDTPLPTEADLPNGSIPTPRSVPDPDASLRLSQEPTDTTAEAPNKNHHFPGKTATPHSPPDSPQDLQVENAPPQPHRKLPQVVRAEPRVLPSQDEASGSLPPDAVKVSQRGSSLSRSRQASQDVEISGPPQRRKPTTTTCREDSSQIDSQEAEAQSKAGDRSQTPVPSQSRRSPNVEGRSRRMTPLRVVSKDRQSEVNEITDEKENQHHGETVSHRDPPSQDICMNKRKLSDKAAVERHPKRLKRKSTSVLMKLAKADRCTPTTRIQRSPGSQDYRHPSTRKDYMHILFLKQALESSLAFKAELHVLLTKTSKTLTTSDWEASLHEKYDCAVVKRVYDWQQRSQWSLRQLKPHPEITSPRTHWDNVLAEARWLQTDFREERKLKLSIASELAHWCKEWHDSSVSHRLSLQARKSGNIAQLGQEMVEHNMQTADDPFYEVESESARDLDPSALLNNLFDNHSPSVSLATKIDLDQSLLDRLPLYEPWKAHHASEQHQILSADMQRMADLRDAMSEDNTSGSQDSLPAPEIAPEDTSCAIWDPAWRQLRSRVNVTFAFKPPAANMPPIGFYEHRRASLWTAGEDHSLKQYAKDFPSNWPLISDRLSNRSYFTPSIYRRTPWECYERLLSMEGGVYSDPGMRQYTRNFQTHIDRIRTRWQSSIQQQLQANQQLQAVPPRFPSPLRVEKYPMNKRYIAILDAARKLARKREAAESNRKQAHHDTQPQGQRAMSSGKNEVYSPQYWSNVKFKQAEEAKRRQENLRQQQRAMMVQGRTQQQPIYNSGLAQTVGGRSANSSSSATTANGHLAVPNVNTHRPQVPQSQTQSSIQGNVQTSGQVAAQLAMGARNQNALPVQQRLAPQFGNTQSISDHSMLQYMQQQARSSTLQAQQRQTNQSQNHASQSSPTMGNAQNAQNVNAMGQFGVANGEPMQSPRLPQGNQTNSNQTSPNLSQILASQFPGGRPAHPHQLSSGHVTVLDSLRHQIAQENPRLTENEVLNLATSQLQKSMRDQTTVNNAQSRALNAAAGVPFSQPRQSGPQSPYMSQQSPYIQNAMLSNPMQGHSDSTGNSLQQQQYTQQMQVQISQQMRRNGMGSPTGTSPHQSSPPMSSAMPYSNGTVRTPTPGQMRPPSAVNIEPQRPGSSQAHVYSAQSPRPHSSQSML